VTIRYPNWKHRQERKRQIAQTIQRGVKNHFYWRGCSCSGDRDDPANLCLTKERWEVPIH